METALQREGNGRSSEGLGRNWKCLRKNKVGLRKNWKSFRARAGRDSEAAEGLGRDKKK